MLRECSLSKNSKTCLVIYIILAIILQIIIGKDYIDTWSLATFTWIPGLLSYLVIPLLAVSMFVLLPKVGSNILNIVMEYLTILMGSLALFYTSTYIGLSIVNDNVDYVGYLTIRIILSLLLLFISFIIRLYFIEKNRSSKVIIYSIHIMLTASLYVLFTIILFQYANVVD